MEAKNRFVVLLVLITSVLVSIVGILQKYSLRKFSIQLSLAIVSFYILGIIYYNVYQRIISSYSTPQIKDIQENEDNNSKIDQE